MNKNYLRKLKILRKKIDKIDRMLIKNLASRMKVSDAIGILKKDFKMPIVQKARWSQIISNRLNLAKKNKLSLKTVNSIFKEIQKESVKRQKMAKRK